MSKSTKIIAALGVVAGLGVAALPAFTYAAQTPQSVSGDAKLFVEVQPAIAMTITGDNDDSDSYTYESWQYAIVASPEGDPSASDYYERAANGTFTKSIDTEVNPSKTYFTRSANTTGVDVFSPMSQGNGVVEGHTEAFKVGPSSSYVSLLPNSTGTMNSTITVYTNNAFGYNLAVKDSDTTTALTKIGGSATIPAADGAVVAGTAKWNLTSDNEGGLSNKAITGSDQTFKTTSTKTGNSGDPTVVTYNIATGAAQETGVYTDTITYTATTNNQ